jgi:hypothetical protein
MSRCVLLGFDRELDLAIEHVQQAHELIDRFSVIGLV